MDIISIIPDSICISNPYSGRLLRVIVAPNSPMNAGNSPVKHPGHAPPSRVPKIPMTGMLAFLFEIYFRSLILEMDRVSVSDTSEGMIIPFISINEIANRWVKFENIVVVVNVLFRIPFRIKYPIKKEIIFIGLFFITSFIFESLCFIESVFDILLGCLKII